MIILSAWSLYLVNNICICIYVCVFTLMCVSIGHTWTQLKQHKIEIIYTKQHTFNKHL